DFPKVLETPDTSDREPTTRRVVASRFSNRPVAHTIPRMNGLMMDYPLTLSTIFRRAETIYRRREIVSRLVDKSIHRYTMGDFADRARRLARVLIDLGIEPGDRVATLG